MTHHRLQCSGGKHRGAEPIQWVTSHGVMPRRNPARPPPPPLSRSVVQLVMTSEAADATTKPTRTPFRVGKMYYAGSLR